MEGMANDVERGHVLIGDFDSGGIEVFVEFATDGQTGCRGGRADEFDDGAVIDERPSAPVPRDEREEAVLDLVPFAGAGRKMEDGDGQSQLVGELLQFGLPEADAGAIAAAAI